MWKLEPLASLLSQSAKAALGQQFCRYLCIRYQWEMAIDVDTERCGDRTKRLLVSNRNTVFSMSHKRIADIFAVVAAAKE